MTYVSNLPRGFSYEWNHWVYRCPEKYCYYGRQVKEENANVSHRCPASNGSTKVAWVTYGPSLLEKTWAELDRITGLLVEGERSEEGIGYARGLAFTLSLFMMPHFTTPADIACEAKKRYKMKLVNEEYETPGLGTRKYEAPPADFKTEKQSPERAKVMSKSKGKQLSDTEEAAIKNAAIMFSVEELAKTYGISVARVKEIIG